MRALLEKEQIPFKSISVYGTPRRLALYIHKLARGKPAQNSEKKGPSLSQAYHPDGKIQPAGEGFFRSLGMPAPALQALREGAIPG